MTTLQDNKFSEMIFKQQPEDTKNERFKTPKTDIYEDDEAIILLTDVPGISEKDIHLTLEKDLLYIEALLKEEQKKPEQNLSYREYETESYKRVFSVSTDIAHDKIKASLKDGVLTLTLPKAEPAKTRKITVQTSEL